MIQVADGSVRYWGYIRFRVVGQEDDRRVEYLFSCILVRFFSCWRIGKGDLGYVYNRGGKRRNPSGRGGAMVCCVALSLGLKRNKKTKNDEKWPKYSRYVRGGDGVTVFFLVVV